MTSNPQDEMQMPEEIWYSQQTVNNNGKEYTIHFASLTKTDENKTRYHIADGFEKYIADRVDERLKEISPRAASGGEALEALKWAEHEISCSHEKVLSRNMPYHIAVKSLNYAKMLNTLIQSATRQPVENKPVEQEEFIEKTGYVDIYDKIIASGFIITRKD